MNEGKYNWVVELWDRVSLFSTSHAHASYVVYTKFFTWLLRSRLEKYVLVVIVRQTVRISALFI